MLGGRQTCRWRNTALRGIAWGRLATSLACAIVLIGTTAADSAADSSWTLPTFTPPHLQRFSFTAQPQSVPPGYSATFLAANDSAAAVGYEGNAALKDPIYLSGGTLTNLQPVLGYGFLDAVAAPGYAVGQVGGHPVFYQPNSQPITLSVSGIATSVALGPLVAVTVTSSAGQDDAELWQPYSGATLDLGAARVGGVEAGGWAVGQTDTGKAWYAAPIGNGRVSEWTLPFAGYLRGVNDFDWAWGYRTLHGGPHPILLDFTSTTSYQSFDFKLSHGYKWGELLGVNYGGLAVGEEYTTLRDLKLSLGTPVYYPDGPDHPVKLGGLVKLSPHTALWALGSVSDNNFMFGLAISRTVGHPVGFFGQPISLLPPIPGKLADLEDILDFDDGLNQSEWTQAVNGIVAIEKYVEAGNDAAACTAISGLGGDIDDYADYLAGYYGEYAAAAVDTLDDLDEVLYELYGELRCPQPLSLPLLGLSPQQSAFYNTPLAPESSGSETITTTVGPVTISGQ